MLLEAQKLLFKQLPSLDRPFADLEVVSVEQGDQGFLLRVRRADGDLPPLLAGPKAEDRGMQGVGGLVAVRRPTTLGESRTDSPIGLPYS